VTNKSPAVVSPDAGADPDVMSMLLDHSESGPDVAAVDSLGMTALHHCAKYGNVETARMLIAAGSDVDARTLHHATPLHYAIESSDADLVDLLMESGCRIDKHRRYDVLLIVSPCSRRTARCVLIVQRVLRMSSGGSHHSQAAAAYSMAPSPDAMIKYGAAVNAPQPSTSSTSTRSSKKTKARYAHM
jgi:ankyrin repeat protein